MSEFLKSPSHNPLQAAFTTAATARLPTVAWLRVMGEDRVRWLNGMTTNSIQALKPGQGCYTFFLNAQGRIQGDATVWMGEENSLLLQTAQERLPDLTEFLDRFIIMDDVELEPVDEQAGIAVIGPDAAAALSRAGLQPPAADGFSTGGSALKLLHVPSPLLPRFELWGPPAELAAIEQAMALEQLTPESLEALRILEGTPRYGTDIRDRELPQETAPAGRQSRALHFSKGCYLGQEIVERIHSRGNVHRVFSGFLLQGERPAPGTALFTAEAADKALGELTSVIDFGGQLYALGYLRREALDRQLPLNFAGGTAQSVSLPFAAPIF